MGYGQHALYFKQPALSVLCSPHQATINDHITKLKLQGYRPETLSSHSRILRRLDRDSDIFNPNIIQEFIDGLSICDGTKEHLVQVYYRFAVTHNIKYEKPKSHYRSPIPRTPSEEDLDLLISSATKRYATILILLKETGLRIGELSNLTKNDFNFAQHIVYIKTLKDGNPRILPLSEHLVSLLVEYFAKKNSFPNPKYLRQHYAYIKKNAFQNTNKAELLKIRLHDFRHFFATRLYYRTHDILLVKKRLGHRSIDSTLVYTQIIETMNPDQYHVATASSIQEATKLIESGFEYITEIDNVKIFRKPK